jgi:hypothetical protein
MQEIDGSRIPSRFLLISLAIFLLVAVVVVNADLFSFPIYEDGDSAVNALQVQNAKHFQELLGNYSRWQFHHPGPAFMYVFAAGEFLFYDLTKLVPAPMNGESLVTMLLNTACMFGGIAIFASYCRNPLFLPVGLAMGLLFIYITHFMTPGFMWSSWMPFTLLFPFFFFMTAAASVAAGRGGHLPLLAVAGMLLIHGHVAQILFVTVLGGLAVAAWVYSEIGKRSLAETLMANAKPIATTGFVIAVFLLPIAVEAARHNPDNIDAIRAYMQMHPGPQQDTQTAAKYYATFLAFLREPDVLLAEQPTNLAGNFAKNRLAVAYWAFCLLLGALAWTLLRRTQSPTHRFFKLVGLEVILVSFLFIFWATRISGPLYGFNGFFFFSIHLMILLLLAALLLEGVRKHPSVRVCGVASWVVVLAALFMRPYLLNYYAGSPMIGQIMSRLPPRPNDKLELQYGLDQLLLGWGLTSAFERSGQQFCVSAPLWKGTLRPEMFCRDDKATRTVRVSGPEPCQGACVVLFQDGNSSVQLRPNK